MVGNTRAYLGKIRINTMDMLGQRIHMEYLVGHHVHVKKECFLHSEVLLNLLDLLLANLFTNWQNTKP